MRSLDGDETRQLNRAYNRALLVGVALFSAVVAFAIFYRFPLESAPYWFFVLGGVNCVLVATVVYQSLAWRVKASLSATELAEAAIRSSHDLFTEVYQHSPVPYLLINKKGEIESLNTAAVRLFRMQAPHLVGGNVFDYLHSDRADHIDMLRDKFGHALSISGEELAVNQKGGGRAWVLLSLFHFTDVERRALGLMTMVDITKQKEIDTAKSEFVSLASHQLRTPIAGMRWNAELLLLDEEQSLSMVQHERIDRLLRSIARLSAVVDDFLSVSRFELGVLTPVYAPIDVTAFFKELVAEQQSQCLQKQLTVAVHHSIVMPVCCTDHNLLGMVVANLLANAIKYTPAGGAITVSVQQTSDSLMVTVADNGIGIPVPEQHRLFNKMFRASNAQRLVTDGTGLGLYICKRAVQVLGGTISVSSAVGLGTTFTVTIPISNTTT